jgi:hypothetical protein
MNTCNGNKKESLKLEKIDYVSSAAKAALGAFPFAGSLLVELAGMVIPNQRIDRIAKFAGVLEGRLSQLEQDFVKSQLRNEDFTDLVEEGLRQAARSLSDERREYIASLISNSLSSKDIEYQESKHLLKVLNELSDIEVIWLRFYLVTTMNGDKEFRDKHKAILEPIPKTVNVPQAIRDKGTFQESYKERLLRLGLLEKENRVLKLTPLGKLLLREIGLIDEKKAKK